MKVKHTKVRHCGGENTQAWVLSLLNQHHKRVTHSYYWNKRK